MMKKEETLTPEKTDNLQKQASAEVIAKIVLVSVDVREAMARRSFMQHKEGAPKKTVFNMNREVLESMQFHLHDYSVHPTKARIQRSLAIADGWLQFSIAGGRKELEFYRSDACIIFDGLRKTSKSKKDKDRYMAYGNTKGVKVLKRPLSNIDRGLEAGLERLRVDLPTMKLPPTAKKLKTEPAGEPAPTDVTVKKLPVRTV